jgi:hypothetical protein
MVKFVKTKTRKMLRRDDKATTPDISKHPMHISRRSSAIEVSAIE